MRVNVPSCLTIFGDSANYTINFADNTAIPTILHLNGTFTLNGLSGTNPLAGTTVEIGRSTVYVSYAGPAADPVASIKAYLASGYNAGGWNGDGGPSSGAITSAAAQGNPLHNTGIGCAAFRHPTPVNATPTTTQ